jgi:large subunit ribosomal protein L21
MYAVIETGGKQYRVELGTELEVELLDARPGQEISLDRILLVVDGDNYAVGQPVVADAAVRAEVLRQDRGKKTVAFKYKPKARSRVKKGHRQELTVLRVTEVRLGSRSAAADAQSAESKAAEDKSRAAKTAARQAAEDQALAERLKVRDLATTAESAATEAKPAAKARPKPAAKPAGPEPKAAAKPMAKARPKPAARPAGPVSKAAAKPAAKSAGPEPKPAAKPVAKAAPKAAAKNEPAGEAAPKRPARPTKKDE